MAARRPAPRRFSKTSRCWSSAATPAIPVTGISYDSRDVRPGHLFVALRGRARGRPPVHRRRPRARRRGHPALPAARGAAAGAAGVARLRPGRRHPPVALPRRRRLPRPALAAPQGDRRHGHGRQELHHLVHPPAARLRGQEDPGSSRRSPSSPATNREEPLGHPFRQSTPEAPEVHGMLAEMVAGGREFAVVEATSHGLSERTNRLGDVLFDAGVLTNVTHEHLEFHGSFAQYRSDKANLFRRLGRPKDVDCPRFGVVNAERSVRGLLPGSRSRARVHLQLRAPGRPLRGRCPARSLGHDVPPVLRAGSREVRIGFPGPFWVDNALAAVLTVSRMLGVEALDLAPMVDRAHVRDRPHGLRGARPALRRGGRLRAHARRIRAAVPVGSLGRPGQDHRGVRLGGRARPRQAPDAGPGRRALVRHRRRDRRGPARRGPDGDSRARSPPAARARPGARTSSSSRTGPRPSGSPSTSARPGDAVLLLGKGHEGSIIGPAGSAAWDERAEAERALRAMGYGA